MSENPTQERARRAREDREPTRWFEELYQDAHGDLTKVPWQRGVFPKLDWIQAEVSLPPGARAKVVGCGLGDDAQALSEWGYSVIGEDCSPEAIAWCQRRFPEGSVRFQCADLLDPESAGEAVDLVVEVRVLQSLPEEVRSQALAGLLARVRPGGWLFSVARERDPGVEDSGPPWALLALEWERVRENCTLIRAEAGPTREGITEWTRLWRRKPDSA